MLRDASARDWPDKCMFAGLLVVMAGGFGVLFAMVLWNGATVGDGMEWFPSAPWWSTLAASCAAIVLGAVCLARQQTVFATAGALCGMASLAFFGFVPLLGLIALALVLKSRLEGEEARGPILRTRWPDKAMAASLFLFVAGILAIGQGALVLAGRFTPILMQDAPVLFGAFDVAAGVFLAFAAREVYHVRRMAYGLLASGLAVATLGLYVVGPLLGLAALAALDMADREGEFRSSAPPSRKRMRKPTG